MRLSILFAIFIILFHGVASEDPIHKKAAKSFRDSETFRRLASKTTDPQERALLTRAAEDHKQAAHGHLKGLQKETKESHKAKAAHHQARAKYYKLKMDRTKDPKMKKFYETRARNHNARVEMRNHLAAQ